MESNLPGNVEEGAKVTGAIGLLAYTSQPVPQAPQPQGREDTDKPGSCRKREGGWPLPHRPLRFRALP